MKNYLRFIGLLLAWAALLRPGGAQAQGTAFSCDGTFYQIRQVNNTSQIFKVDRSAAAYTTTSLSLGGSNDLGVLLNGLAYNAQDGFMYAITTPGAAGANNNAAIYLYKIGQNGAVRVSQTAIKVSGAAANLGITVAGGGFDTSGNYYFTAQNTGPNGTQDFNLYKLVVNSSTPTVATSVPLNTGGYSLYDLAFNPIDGGLYGTSFNGSLYKIAPGTGSTTTIATTPNGNVNAANAVGTLFFDIAGNLFAYTNGTVGTDNSANFYQVNTTSGAYTFISAVSPASVSDGASCINPDQRIDVTKELTNVAAINATTFDISYTIRVRNSATATDDFVQVSDLLFGTTTATKANTTFPNATSVTVQGTPVVTNLDGSSLAANTGFTGVSGNASLLRGTAGLTAGQRAAITYTVRVVYPAGGVPSATTAQNNTAYATSSSVSPNNGYTQAANGTLLTPSDLEANDASTNSSDYPALRVNSTDTPSPTPLYFAPSISGIVFEDVNYGGGAGRSQLGSTGVGRGGARVELYTSAGLFSSSTTTAADGSYSFTGLSTNTSYTVRVVNSTVSSSRPGYVAGLLPVQTYRTTATATTGTTPDLNRVGGEDPARTDAAAGTTGSTLTTLTVPSVAGVSIGTIPESQAPVTFSTVGAPTVNVDFGYNFDTVVNTNDVTTVSGTSAQGSLRQFLLNSNALGGEAALAQVYTNTAGAATALPVGVEKSIFMIPNGQAIAGQQAGLTSGFATSGTGGGAGTSATIKLLAALPNITGPSTSLDGGTQTSATGNSNAAVATTGSESLGAEVAINFNNLTGFSTSAANTSLLNLDLTNANTAGGSNMAAFSILAGATSAVVQNNTFYKNGANLAINGVGGATISNNISRDALSNNSDGIEVTGSSNNTIAGNQFLNNAGFGIDFIAGTSTGNAITGNTFSRNGQNSSNGQTAGIGLRTANASGNTVSGNTFTNNVGDGISATAGTNNVFSQNSFANNGDLAIDLAPSSSTSYSGDGVTLNTLSTTTATHTGANNLLNFPVLTTATVSANNLVVNGYAGAGNLVELYLAAPDPTNFGEGATYLTSFTQGTAVGTVGNVMTGAADTYSGSINGLNQGTDRANTFTATIPLSSLTPAQRAALQGGAAVLTSTATLAGSGTSEFSGNLVLTVADVTVSLAGPTTLSAGQPTGTFTATFTNEGPGAAAEVSRTITLPVGASLSDAQKQALINPSYTPTYTTTGSGATAITTINFGPVTLASHASSAVSFTFTAPAAVGTNLTLTANTTAASQGTNLAPDQVTLNLSTVATANVQVTSITPSTTATTGKFAVVFANNGPQTAAGVAYSVQLPAGLAGVMDNNGGGTYNSITGLVTYPNAATTLASGGTFASDITYPLATAPNAPVTATARVSTTTDEGGLTANNAASATMPAQFDLTTTLSGPAAAVAGSPTTLYVTTTNLGPNTAPAATQTVTIPSAATLAGSIYITNGGTYSFSNGVGTVTFPVLPNVPGGQTITNSLSFLAPAANFAPSATVTNSSATPETNPNNNVAYLNGATASASVTVSTVAALSNEATTIEATTTTNGTTTPATVVDVNAPITYLVKSFNKGYSAATASATVVEQVQLLPGLTTTTLKVGTAAPTTLANGNLSFANAAGTTTYNPNSGLLTYYSVTQAAGESTTYDAITVTAPAAVGNGGQLLATASVQTTNFLDPVPSDNVAAVAVRVRTRPDLTTSVSGPSSTTAGLPATYVVRFTNSGTNDAATVTETAQLPAGLSGVSITDVDGNPVAGAYASGTGLVTFPGLVTDAVGATQVYTIQLNAPGQTFPVTSTIAGLTSDGVATNNSATQVTTVAANADLAVNITGPTTAVIGNPITYVVTTTNNGPSMATAVQTTLQLPQGLTNVEVSSSASYNAATGLLTFAQKGALTPGGSTTNYVTFTMPSATATGDPAVSNGLILATAAVTSTSTDQVAANNTAALTTSVSPTTSDVADLATSISRPSGSATTVPAGTLLTYTVAYRNVGPNPATSVMRTVNLPTGLTDLTLNGTGTTGAGTGVTGTRTGDVITFGGTTNGLPNGATYNLTTGLLTFPAVASLAQSPNSDSYSISFTAPANDVQVISEIASATTDNGPKSNRSLDFVTISANVDVATALTGPTTAQPGTTVTYAVTTVDNGPSLNPNSTFQTVTLPAGVTPVAGSYPNGTYSGNTITWTIPFGQAPGAANAVVNTFSLVMPATGSVMLNASLTSTGENANNPVSGANNTTNNTATLTTNPANQAPVAENIWNTLRGARANNAAALPISPLLATDTDGSISSYTVTRVPDPAQGTLYYNGAAIANNAVLTAADGLSFVPAAGFVGNATFSYLATDNGGVKSPVALYTIPVAKDQDAAYTTTPAKSGANKYAVNDVLAAVVDPNTATYTAAGRVYDATTGKLLTGAASGLLLTGTNAVLAGTGPSGNAANTLPAGVSLDPATGQIYVSDVSATGLMNNPTVRTYSVNVTTTDANGGISLNTVTFTIGAYPLPVVLTAFTAQAVQNRDAQLSWNTATEVNSAAFDIERSFDGASFAKIGEVTAQGTTATAHAYAFTDAGVAARAQGPVYYRLRQVDLNGTAAYSPVRTVRFVKVAAAALSLYPNPAAASTNLDLSALPATGSYRVLVLDATGRQVLAATLGGGLPQPLDLTGLASGTYQVLVTGTLADGSALRQVLRLTKE